MFTSTELVAATAGRPGCQRERSWSLQGGVTDWPSCRPTRSTLTYRLSKLAAHEQTGLLIGTVPDSPRESFSW